MAEKKNIIGIVKELQQDIVDISEMPGSPANAKKQAQFSVWLEQVGEAFPAIAEALLIAVEALEFYQQHADERIAGLPRVDSAVAKGALSRIHSL